MRISRSLSYFVALTSLLLASKAMAWGDIGHSTNEAILNVIMKDPMTIGREPSSSKNKKKWQTLDIDQCQHD